MQIDFLGLQAFLAIAEHGSFQRAAAQLNLSQTAVSHRLKKLEDFLGQRLVARTTRAVTLTDAGRELLPKARAAVGELGASLAALRAHGASRRPWLGIACLPTIASHQFAPALERFVAKHPQADVRVYDVSIGEIAELVASDAVEFGLTVETGRRGELDAEAIGDEDFVVVCPAAHRLAGLAAVRWSDLRDETMVRIGLPAGNGATIDEAVSALGMQLTWRYEVQRTALALALVRAGMGVTIVPRLAVGADAALATRPLVEPVVTRRLQLVTRPGAAMSEGARDLCSIIVARLAAALEPSGRG